MMYTLKRASNFLHDFKNFALCVRTRENILYGEVTFHGFSPVLHKTLLQKFRYNAIVMSTCSFLVIQYKIKY